MFEQFDEPDKSGKSHYSKGKIFAVAPMLDNHYAHSTGKQKQHPTPSLNQCPELRIRVVFHQ